MPEKANIALRLREMATRLPLKRAVVFPESCDACGRVAYTHLTFSQLDRESDAIARGFLKIGIKRGTRTLLMCMPSLEFFALTFALFKVGAVPVLIDPGMGLKRLLHCIRNAEPEALVGIPKAHAARVLFRSYFRSVKINVTVGARWFWGGHSLSELKHFEDKPLELADTDCDELAAILFTTGSTGPAKGVEYEHGMFVKQCELLEKTYGIGPDDIDLPTFPLFALFSVGLGMTAVIPDMDPTKPGFVDPRKIIAPIMDQGCTFSFGSPALWNRVTKYCVANDIKLPSLRQVLMAGAPVPPEIHERFRQILVGEFETNTPYGATESLPASNMTGSEVIAETAALTNQGRGICVGRPVPGQTVRVIRVSDEPIAEWSDDLLLPDGEVGEITVKGPTVTKRYYKNEKHTALHKINEGGQVVHRIGDLGYFDKKGRLWFCGRKGHRVETTRGRMYSVCCEAIFNQHPKIFRSALVGIGEYGSQKPAIIIQPESLPQSEAEKSQLIKELLDLGAAYEHTKSIETILFHPAFPVDIRHNAKINREELAVWAAARVAG